MIYRNALYSMEYVYVSYEYMENIGLFLMTSLLFRAILKRPPVARWPRSAAVRCWAACDRAGTPRRHPRNLRWTELDSRSNMQFRYTIHVNLYLITILNTIANNTTAIIAHLYSMCLKGTNSAWYVNYDILRLWGVTFKPRVEPWRRRRRWPRDTSPPQSSWAPPQGPTASTRRPARSGRHGSATWPALGG